MIERGSKQPPAPHTRRLHTPNDSTHAAPRSLRRPAEMVSSGNGSVSVNRRTFSPAVGEHHTGLAALPCDTMPLRTASKRLRASRPPVAARSAQDGPGTRLRETRAAASLSGPPFSRGAARQPVPSNRGGKRPPLTSSPRALTSLLLMLLRFRVVPAALASRGSRFSPRRRPFACRQRSAHAV